MVNVTFKSSPEGAAIYLDSVDTGAITPYTIDVLEGTHTYFFRLTGHQDTGNVFTVVPGIEYVIESMMIPVSSERLLNLYEKMVEVGIAGVAIAAIAVLVQIIGGKKDHGR